MIQRIWIFKDLSFHITPHVWGKREISAMQLSESCIDHMKEPEVA